MDIEITREQAILISESGLWQDMTDNQLFELLLFGLRLCCPMSELHRVSKAVLGRSVYTHELALNRKGLIAEYLGERPAPTLDEIIAPIKDKLIFVQQ